MSCLAEASDYCMEQILLEGREDAPEMVCLIHGWPDDLHIWDRLVAALLEVGEYRCLRVTLPGYREDDGENSKQPLPAAPNFHEAARLLARVIEDARKGGEQVTLVQHDWGSVVGFQLQRQFPDMVKRMVVMDVGPMDLPWGVMLYAGLYYQWFNQVAYLVWRYVPVIGRALGNLMHRISVRRFKSEPWNKGPARLSASAAYFYHHVQRDYWLSWLGRASPLLGSPSLGEPNPSCPALFLYGTGGLGKLFARWHSTLHRRPDCDVLSLPGNHWFLLQSPNETNAAVIRWLGQRGGGKLRM